MARKGALKTWRSGPPSRSPGKDELERLYLQEKRSYADIARRYDVTKTTIKRWLRAAGISAREVGEATRLGMANFAPTEAHLAKLRENAAKARANITPASHAKQSTSMKGRPPPNKGKPMSEAQRQQMIAIRSDPEYRRKMSERFMGERSPNWKGGKKPELDRRLDRADWRRLRKQIYERDNWTCQDCGKKCLSTRDARAHPKLKIQCHHVKARRVGGLDDPSNLVTLCMSCHQKRERKGE